MDIWKKVWKFKEGMKMEKSVDIQKKLLEKVLQSMEIY